MRSLVVAAALPVLALGCAAALPRGDRPAGRATEDVATASAAVPVIVAESGPVVRPPFDPFVATAYSDPLWPEPASIALDDREIGVLTRSHGARGDCVRFHRFAQPTAPQAGRAELSLRMVSGCLETDRVQSTVLARTRTHWLAMVDELVDAPSGGTFRQVRVGALTDGGARLETTARLASRHIANGALAASIVPGAADAPGVPSGPLVVIADRAQMRAVPVDDDGRAGTPIELGEGGAAVLAGTAVEGGFLVARWERPDDSSLAGALDAPVSIVFVPAAGGAVEAHSVQTGRVSAVALVRTRAAIELLVSRFGDESDTLYRLDGRGRLAGEPIALDVHARGGRPGPAAALGPLTFMLQTDPRVAPGRNSYPHLSYAIVDDAGRTIAARVPVAMWPTVATGAIASHRDVAAFAWPDENHQRFFVALLRAPASGGSVVAQ